MKCVKFSFIAAVVVVVAVVSGCKVSHTIKVKQSQPEQEQEVQIDSNGNLTPLTLVIMSRQEAIDACFVNGFDLHFSNGKWNEKIGSYDHYVLYLSKIEDPSTHLSFFIDSDDEISKVLSDFSILCQDED